jgi:hypothetical protein
VGPAARRYRSSRPDSGRPGGCVGAPPAGLGSRQPSEPVQAGAAASACSAAAAAASPSTSCWAACWNAAVSPTSWHVVAADLDDRRARLAIADLHALSLTRYPHLPLVERVWELRHNLTPTTPLTSTSPRRPSARSSQRTTACPTLPAGYAQWSRSGRGDRPSPVRTRAHRPLGPTKGGAIFRNR